MFSHGDSYSHANGNSIPETSERGPVSERYIYATVWQDRDDK